MEMWYMHIKHFTQLYASMYDEVAEVLFSVQSQFASQAKHGWKNSNVSVTILRDLNWYGRADAVTGNLCKDQQHKEAYDSFDCVHMSILIDEKIIQVPVS